MADNKDLDDVAKTATDDFYALLNVTFDVEESELKRAYRKASVKVHPDKNPDDAAAADKFIRLGIARDILADLKLKTTYDHQRQRRREKALQHELLDGRRRKMKEDLERREREGGTSMKRKRMDEMNEAEKRDVEIQRLAEDGKRRRKEHQERLERQREEEEASFVDISPEPEQRTHATAPGQSAEIDRTIKILFQREREALVWDKARISDMFEKYGKIDSIVMGKDKKTKVPGEKHKKLMVTVFIVYTRLDHAHAAVMDAKRDYVALEYVSWVSKEPEIKSPTNGDVSAPSTPVSTPKKAFKASFGLGKGFGSAPGTPKFSFSPKTPSLEEVTMMRLKQAEKRRLEDQIRQQEAAEEAAS